MQGVLVEHDALLRSVIELHAGRPCAHLGDGWLAAFASVVDAVGAAIDGQRALRAAEWGELTISVRMAVCASRAAAQRLDNPDLTARRCRRLLAIGHGGQILLSSAAADVVRTARPDGVRVQSLGWHRLRDFAPREQVFQLVHASLPAAFPPLKSRWSDRWRRYAAGRMLLGWPWATVPRVPVGGQSR